MKLITKRERQLEKALKDLVNMYVANRNAEDGCEFITCITPPTTSEMTRAERKKNRTWKAWDRARRLLGDKV